MPTPSSINVVVYGGKCLSAKKGNGEPLAWVIFGFGKSKCCTNRVKSSNPKWNQENTFKISDPKLPLKITIKDKDDTLGQIKIPLADIPYEEHTFKWVAVGPHRRNLNPTGEICIDCWITEYKDGDIPTKKGVNFLKFKEKLNIKQFSERERTGSIKYGGRSMKGSVSVEDLGAVTYKPTFSRTLERPKPLSAGLKRATSMFLNLPKLPSPRSDRSPSLTELSPVAEKSSNPPEIKYFTPISGPNSGGTLIQVNGKNLGEGIEDIILLTVAGYDCLATVEYLSSTRLMCTTPPGRGVGPVSLSTVSGGSCVSKTNFEFEGTAQDNSNTNGFAPVMTSSPKVESLTPVSKKQGSRPFSFGSKTPERKDADEGLKKEVEQLTQEVKVLKTENNELKNYVDRLLLYLMEKYPEALESRRLYR